MIGAGTIGLCTLDGVFRMLDGGTGDTLWQADGSFLLSGARGQTIYAFDGQGHKLALERDGTIRAANDGEFVRAPTVATYIRSIYGTLCTVESSAHYGEATKKLLWLIGEAPEVVLSNDSAAALLDEQTGQLIWRTEPVWGDMVSPFPWDGYIFAGVAQPGRTGQARVLAYRDPLVPAP